MLGRDVMLLTVQGGNGAFGRDVMLQTVHGEGVGGERRDVTEGARGKLVVG